MGLPHPYYLACKSPKNLKHSALNQIGNFIIGYDFQLVLIGCFMTIWHIEAEDQLIVADADMISIEKFISFLNGNFLSIHKDTIGAAHVKEYIAIAFTFQECVVT